MSVEPLVNDRTIYSPQWRDRLANGELSPSYGPSHSQFLKLTREFNQSVQGGGIWDFSREPKRARQRKKLHKAREEAVRIMEWVHIHHAELPERELEAAYHVWRDGCSPNQAAKRMTTERRTIRTWNKRTMERMKRGQDG